MTRATQSRAPRRKPKPVAAAAGGGLSGDDVVDAALRVVEREGADALTMRRLADELGTAVTAIYWHVGNRDALVDLLVGRLLEEMGDVHATGRDPGPASPGWPTSCGPAFSARPHLIALADQRGLTAAMFQPMQAALAGELATMGITGRRAGQVIQMLQCHVVASVVLARAIDRSRAHDTTEPKVWEGRAADPELVAGPGRQPDLDAAFAFGLDALLDRLHRHRRSRRRRRPGA